MTFAHEKYQTTMARVRAGEGFIYVAEVEGTDHVKIGFSIDPEHRVRAISRRGMRLRLMGYFPASIHSERKLHRRIASSAVPRNTYCSVEVYPRHVFTVPAELRGAS